MEQPPENLIQTIQDMLSTCIDGLCEVLTEDRAVPCYPTPYGFG